MLLGVTGTRQVSSEPPDLFGSRVSSPPRCLATSAIAQSPRLAGHLVRQTHAVVGDGQRHVRRRPRSRPARCWHGRGGRRSRAPPAARGPAGRRSRCRANPIGPASWRPGSNPSPRLDVVEDGEDPTEQPLGPGRRRTCRPKMAARRSLIVWSRPVDGRLDPDTYPMGVLERTAAPPADSDPR